MKMKGLVLASIINLAVLMPQVHADMVFHADPNVCSKLPGHWGGDGKVSALGGFVTCKYHGEADISSFGDSSTYNLHIVLNRTSGICPSSETLDLQETCSNGTIIIKTDAAHLTGALNSDGTAVTNMNGTVDFPVVIAGKTQTITAAISDMNLNKK